MRLNKFIGQAGVCSRRKADELISKGCVCVNGVLITKMGYQVEENDKVHCRGKLLQSSPLIYTLLNKPKDCITTTSDPQGRDTVLKLVCSTNAWPNLKHAEGRCVDINTRLYPIGRLDRSTTGLLILTNDGELSQCLMHPSGNVKKIYQVELNQPLRSDHLIDIRKGVLLEDGKVVIDEIEYIKPHVLGISIHMGKNRVIRRLFEHLGYQAVKLDRVCYAELTKKNLPRGKWRFLTSQEVAKLKKNKAIVNRAQC